MFLLSINQSLRAVISLFDGTGRSRPFSRNRKKSTIFWFHPFKPSKLKRIFSKPQSVKKIDTLTLFTTLNRVLTWRISTGTELYTICRITKAQLILKYTQWPCLSSFEFLSTVGDAGFELGFTASVVWSATKWATTSSEQPHIHLATAIRSPNVATTYLISWTLGPVLGVHHEQHVGEPGPDVGSVCVVVPVYT